MSDVSRKRITRSTVLAALAALALVAAACGGDEEESSSVEGEYSANAAGFVIEPSGEPGPDAFTPSVETGTDGEGAAVSCDKQLLLTELQARPDALREWAAVLGVAQEDVPAYIETLEPKVLEEDTPVTNHGLHDGRAYARQSVLRSGTAVLVDLNFMPPEEILFGDAAWEEAFRRAPPDAIVIVPKDTSEFGRGPFGIGYGTRLAAWIREEYAPAASLRIEGVNYAVQILVRRNSPT